MEDELLPPFRMENNIRFSISRREAMLRPVAEALPGLILTPKNNIKVLVAGALSFKLKYQ